jgi:cyclopropane fatty-acyl-phospholipid synthase-like methyltransferase
MVPFADALAQEHRQHTPGKANQHMHRRPVDDLIRDFESPERDAYQKPEVVMAWLGELHQKTVMDLGTGSGYFAVRLAAAGAKVIAADVNDDFLDKLKQRINKLELEDRISLRKLEYDSPQLSDGEVDMVFMVNVYHHIEDRIDYFTKVLNGIKPGGTLVVIDFYKRDLPVGPPPDHKVSLFETMTELNEAGFKKFELDMNLLEYQYMIKALK